MLTADVRRIVTTMTATAMVSVSIAESAQSRRLVEFAGDVAELADRRRDLELRELIDRLHADLIRLTEED